VSRLTGANLLTWITITCFLNPPNSTPDTNETYRWVTDARFHPLARKLWPQSGIHRDVQLVPVKDGCTRYRRWRNLREDKHQSQLAVVHLWSAAGGFLRNNRLDLNSSSGTETTHLYIHRTSLIRISSHIARLGPQHGTCVPYTAFCSFLNTFSDRSFRNLRDL